MRPPVRLPLDSLVPAPELFSCVSELHGPAHVARVMVHAFRLIAATGWTEEAPRLWAAVYLHDLARTHEGTCHRHGRDAITKLERLPHVRALFTKGGVHDEDYPAIETAVTYHCLPKELDRSHQHWRLTSLLKDADGLDRVRLFDVNPAYLRNPEAKTMIGFATALFEESAGIPTGPGHFSALWKHAVQIQERSKRTARRRVGRNQGV